MTAGAEDGQATMVPAISRTALYVRQMADLLGLKDWDIKLMDEPCGEDLDGYINMVSGQRKALLYLSHRYHEEPADARRHTIAHELIHCHFHEVQACVERNAGIFGAIGKILEVEHVNFIEHGVDAVALAIAPYLPEEPDGTIEHSPPQEPARKQVRGPRL